MKTLLSVAGCLLVLFAEPVVDREKSAALVEKLGTVDNPHERSEVYEQLFAAVGPQGIRDLQTHANDSIALQAGWKRVMLTVPPGPGNKVGRPGIDQLNWFLGYFEGRTRCSPPDWWREMLLDARVSVWGIIHPGFPKKNPYHSSGGEFVTCPIDTTIEDAKGKCVLRIGKEKIVVPEELLDRNDGSLCKSISGCFTSDRCFVTEHEPGGYPHTLGCVDKSTGQLLWKSEVCGCWLGGGSGSPPETYVKVVTTTDNRVAVFGMDATGFYFHCFRATDGKSLAQFSTLYAK
jgi:hypothetical protein